jgi:hypothetical protein
MKTKRRNQMIDNLELSKRFTYHPPKGNQSEMYQQLRKEAALLAASIRNITPECREQSLAITKIEEAIFWANAAIARRC